MTKKLLLILFCFTASCLWIKAQVPELKFNIKAGSKSVKIVYRLSKAGDKATVDYGNGEQSVLEQTKEGELMTSNYSFQSVSSESRTMTITADNIVVLRLAANTAINGIISLDSPSLLKFNCDFTKLTESETIDFSKCPNIEEITLNDADVIAVNLPKEPKLKTFQCSPSLASQKALKIIDLTKCTQLETLGLKGVALDTIDLRACSNLKHLVIAGLSTKVYPKALLGAKAMKKLEFVNIQMCAFGYDMLPDLNETPLEQFTCNKQFPITINPNRINGLTVDMSHLATAKGIAPTLQNTVFNWQTKENNTWVKIPADKITQEEGVFAFDPSLLNGNENLNVRCQLFNAGYPDIEYYKSSGFTTRQITLQGPQPLAILTTTSLSPGKDEDDEPIDELSITMQLGAAKANTPIMIDWGDGITRDYTIGSTEPVSISETVDLGAQIKLYGEITLIDASKAYLTAIVLGDATKLERLRLSQNKIESINLNAVPNLKELMITDNKISDLNLSVCPKLEELYCGYNNLTQLNVKDNTKLSVLNCYNNHLTSLDVSALKELEIFVPSDNKLESPLDLSNNTNLRTLDIANCELSEVKLNSQYLRRVAASGNKLTSLQISRKGIAKYLYYLDIRKNNFDACGINDILTFLSENPEDINDIAGGCILQVKNNTGASTYDYSLLSKNQATSIWKVDTKGDGSGCNTAKIFDNGNTEFGTASIWTDNTMIAFGTPIEKNKNITIKISPNQGYEVDFVKFDKLPLSPENTENKTFNHILKQSGLLTYDFKISTSIDNVFSKELTITRCGNEFIIEKLAIGQNYTLSNILGQIIKSGTILSNGILRFTLNDNGCYLLRIGKSTIKLIR